VARKAEATIWVRELTERRLSPIYIKSGRTADSHLKFDFDQPVSTGWLLAGAILGVGPGRRRVRGPLPLTRRWRRTLLGSRVGAGVAAPLSVFVLLTSVSAPAAWHTAWLDLGFVLLAATLVLWMIYGALKPKGEVFKTPQGELWLGLRDVHPNFASAIDALDDPVTATAAPPTGG
jgi:hypothetical protein